MFFYLLLNGRVFVYELSGCGFESRCSHPNIDNLKTYGEKIATFSELEVHGLHNGSVIHIRTAFQHNVLHKKEVFR